MIGTMHTLRAALLGGCVMCAGTAFAQDAITQANNKWYTDGQAAIDAALTIQLRVQAYGSTGPG